MSTWLIVTIVVVGLILLGLLFLLPRMRRKGLEREAEKQLEARRDQVATEHREEASTRASRAEAAERQAVIAQREAEAERARAEQHEHRAQLHERGLADDELMGDTPGGRSDHESGASARGDGGADRASGTRDPVGRAAGTTTDHGQRRRDERERH